MKILHVVPTYLPARRYGGPIFAVHGLARALVERGHHVDVFTTNVDGDGESDVPLRERVDLDGVGVYYFSSPMRRLYWSPQLRKALNASIRGPAISYDVTHLHSVFLYPTAAAARAAEKAHVPYVISPRGMLVPELIAAKSRWTKTAWLRLIERRNFSHAAAIHFTTEREREDAKRTKMPVPASFIVPNGIVLSGASAASPAQRDPDTILSLGRINWKKGIDRLIAALPHVDNARLVIAGNDEENLTPRLKELAERLGVANRVEFLGRVDGEAKDALLARATIFALTSMSENFGNVVLEAMAAETPVILTAEVGLSEEVRRARAGVVVPAQPREIANAIRKLLDEPDERRAMGARGRHAVETRFTWPRVAEEMEAQYARLLR
ncbi:MAG TPA: glycosyltransferase [Thermoanaerobaculia bacterium]|nr:glycosyltransferase [Thermoanaerobaculia bacterium]